MGWLAKVVLFVLVFSSGFALGYVVRGWTSGLDVGIGDAQRMAQLDVDVGAAAQQRVIDAWRASEHAQERVRVVERTIEVDRGCPPGRGAVSADVAHELRGILDKRSRAGTSPGRLPDDVGRSPVP